MRSLFYDPKMEPYYRAGQRLLEQQKEKMPEPQTRRPKPRKPETERADRAVVAVFASLQNIWRRQGTLRRIYDVMPSSREERGAWKQLIEYLTKREDWA